MLHDYGLEELAQAPAQSPLGLLLRATRQDVPVGDLSAPRRTLRGTQTVGLRTGLPCLRLPSGHATWMQRSSPARPTGASRTGPHRRPAKEN